MALKTEKPMVLHLRGPNSLAVAKEVLESMVPKKWPIHMHGFTNSWKICQPWAKDWPNMKFGLLSDKFDPEIIRNLPMNRILLETDAPYFPPLRLRNNGQEKINISFPSDVWYVANQIAYFLGKKVEVVLAANRKNVSELYKIRPADLRHKLKENKNEIPSPTTTTICLSCDDKHPAIAHCHDCKENLCETCVGAHKRVSMTKFHRITNEIVQASPGFNKQQTTSTTTTTCSSCEDKPPAIAHCQDCRENLCETCVGAHRRVSMTRAHHITNLLPHGMAGPSGATLESLRTSIAMTHQASPMPGAIGKNMLLELVSVHAIFWLFQFIFNFPLANTHHYNCSHNPILALLGISLLQQPCSCRRY